MPQEYLRKVKLLKHPCKDDDERFTQDPGIARACRIRWIYEVIRRCYRAEPEEIKEAFLKMLEGKEEDVWLWVNGDEVSLPEPAPWGIDKPLYALAAKALQTRQEASEHIESREMAEMIQRVQEESPEVRLAAILWLVLTSKAMKKLYSEHGFMDREEWDLSGLIEDWWSNLLGVYNQLPDAPTEEFERAMEKEGHACHTEHSWSYYSDEPKTIIGRWLYVQSVLFPERAGAPVNLMHRNRDNKIQCQTCRSYANQHYFDRQNILYEPSPCAVLLAVVHRQTSDHRDPSFPEWIAALSSRRDYKKLTSAGHHLCQTFERQPEAWNVCRARWIQSYSPSWYDTLSSYSSRTWKLVDPILGSGLSSRSETIPDFATWLAAAIWTIYTHDQSLTVGKRVALLDCRLKFATKELDSTLLPCLDPPNTDTVENFQRKIKNSSHTCWDRHDPRWYASVVSYLNDNNDPKFVPGPRARRCNKCSLVNHAHQFAKMLSDCFRPDDELSKHLAGMRDQFQELGYQWSYDNNQDSDEAGSADNRDVQHDPFVHPVASASETIPQTQSGIVGSHVNSQIIDNTYSAERTTDHYPAQVPHQPALLQDTPQPVSLPSIWQSDLSSNPPPTSVSQQGRQSISSHGDFQMPSSSLPANHSILSTNYGALGFGISSHGNLLPDPPQHLLSNSPPFSVAQQGRPSSISSHENFQVPYSSFPASHNILSADYGSSGLGTSSHRNLLPDPPSYDDVSSPYNSRVSMEIGNTQTVDGSHQTSQAIPPPSQPRSMKEKKIRPKKAAMIREVKRCIIDELLDAGVRLSKFRDNYTLPWTQLEQNLKEWRIEMLNWPQEVERDDSIKGIHGLNDKEVKSLWDVVQNKDPGKRLQFRRLGPTAEEVTSRKRRADALDDDNSEGRSCGSKSQRLNEQGLRVWDPTHEFHNHDTGRKG